MNIGDEVSAPRMRAWLQEPCTVDGACSETGTNVWRGEARTEGFIYKTCLDNIVGRSGCGRENAWAKDAEGMSLLALKIKGVPPSFFHASSTDNMR